MGFSTGKNYNIYIVAEGTHDSRCFIQGHDWDDWKPYFGSSYNGRHRRCRTCNREVVELPDEWPSRWLNPENVTAQPEIKWLFMQNVLSLK